MEKKINKITEYETVIPTNTFEGIYYTRILNQNKDE